MTNGDVTRLWHTCLGHMSENGVIELRRRGLLDGHITSKLKFYEHCAFRKQSRVKFSKGIHNTKGTLNYLNFDLYHPKCLLMEVLITC